MERFHEKKPDSVFDGAGPFKDLLTGVCKDLYTANFVDRSEARNTVQLGQGAAILGRDLTDVDHLYAHVQRA